MSLATVEAHLTRIYRKLGIRSRSELARLVHSGSVVRLDRRVRMTRPAAAVGGGVELVGRAAEQDRLYAFAAARRGRPARAAHAAASPGSARRCSGATASSAAARRASPSWCRGRPRRTCRSRSGAWSTSSSATSSTPTRSGPRTTSLARGRAVLGALRRLAASRPTVVAIDDTQWLDSASARALGYAFRHLEDERVGVLADRAARRRSAGGGSLPPRARLESVELGPLGLARSPPDARGHGRVDLHGRRCGGSTRRREATRCSRSSSRAVSRAGTGCRASTGAVQPPESLPAAIARTGGVGAARAHAAARDRLGARPCVDGRAAGGASRCRRRRAARDGRRVRAAGRRGRRRPLRPPARRLGRLRAPGPARAPQARTVGSRAAPATRTCGRATSHSRPTRRTGPIADLLEAAARRAHARGAFDVAAELGRHSLRLTPRGDTEAALTRRLLEIEDLARSGEVGRAVGSLGPADRADCPPGRPAPGADPALGPRDRRSRGEHRRPRACARGCGRGRRAPRPGAAGARVRALSRARRPAPARWSRREQALAHPAAAARARPGDAPARRDAASRTWRRSPAGPDPDVMARAVEREDELGRRRRCRGGRASCSRSSGAGPGSSRRRARCATASDSSAENQRPYRLYDLALLECAAGDFAAAEELVREGLEAARDAGDGFGERAFSVPARAPAGVARPCRRRRARPSAVMLERALRSASGSTSWRRGACSACSRCRKATCRARATSSSRPRGCSREIGIAHPGLYPVLPDAVEALARTGDDAGAETLLERLELQADSGRERLGAGRCRAQPGAAAPDAGRDGGGGPAACSARRGASTSSATGPTRRARPWRSARRCCARGRRTLAADGARGRPPPVRGDGRRALGSDARPRSSSARRRAAASGELTVAERRIAALVGARPQEPGDRAGARCSRKRRSRATSPASTGSSTCARAASSRACSRTARVSRGRSRGIPLAARAAGS